MEKTVANRRNRMLKPRENVLFSMKGVLFCVNVEMRGCRGEQGPG